MQERHTLHYGWRAMLCILLLASVVYAAAASMGGSRAANGNTAGTTAPTGDFANGGVLPNGRLVTPAGRRYTLGDFPLGVAVSPDGVLAVAINSGQGIGLNAGFNSYCGQGQGVSPCPYTMPADPSLAHAVENPATPAPDESLTVVNLRTGQSTEVKAVTTAAAPSKRGAPGTFNFFYTGVIFSPDGKHLYAAGGGNDAVYDFPVACDVVAARPIRTVMLPSSMPSFLSAGITKGLAVTPDGRYLLVGHELGQTLDIVDTSSYHVSQVTLGLPVIGNAYPYGVIVSPNGRTAYVALQGAGMVAVVDLKNGHGTLHGTVKVGDHPVAVALSPDGAQLYVANVNGDSLTVVSTALSTVTATIPLHVLPGEAPGTMPDAVAVSADGQRIYVALAGDNAVAVLGARTPGAGSPQPSGLAVLGYIPSGWYPSAVAINPRDGSLAIVSAKGLGSRPTAITSTYQYDANNMPGLLQTVQAPTTAQLQEGTATVTNNILFSSAMDVPRSPHNAIPATPGGATPIQHVVLIVRENRTFDQELGDAGVDPGRTPVQLDGVPSYAVFGRAVTPNAHALVGDPIPGTADPAFATADNFYSDGEASIQGHYWTSSASVSDYVEKSWRLYYSPRRHLQDPISSLGEPAHCSIFQSAATRQKAVSGFSFKDYGEITGIANPDAIASGLGVPGNTTPGVSEHCAAVPSRDVTFMGGSNFSLDMDNRATAKAFLADSGLNPDGTPLQKAGPNTLRTFSYILMSGDHTGGLSFQNTPRSRVAQNDAGLGMIVQALSRSRYWSSTAIFVMEDDSQDGLDHRDGHRNLLYVISPYTKHAGPDGKPGYVSHYHYDQASVLKTIELILGFPYLSAYDQNARALYELFQDKDTPSQLTTTDLAPFTLQPAPSFIDETSAKYRKSSPAASFLTAGESRSLNLWAPDLAGPLLEIINWQIAHPGEPVPAALRAAQSTWHPYTFGGPDRDVPQ